MCYCPRGSCGCDLCRDRKTQPAIKPGRIRLCINAPKNLPASSTDIALEVLAPDGSWVKITQAFDINMSIRPNELVELHFKVYLNEGSVMS